MPCPPNKVILRTPGPLQRSTYCTQSQTCLPSSLVTLFSFMSPVGEGAGQRRQIRGKRVDGEPGKWGVRPALSPVCSSFLSGFPKGLCSQAPGMKGQFWQRAQFQYPCRRKFHSPALSYAGWPRQTHPDAIPRAPPIPASFHITARPPSTWQQASRTPVFTILPLPRSPRPGPDPLRPSQGACWTLGSGPHWRGSGSRMSVWICISH